jgi:tannase/feruloyl esterase
MTRKALIGILEGDAGDLLLITLTLERELQDCHGQYIEVILKNAGTLLALVGLVANRPGGAAMPTTAEEYRAKARECEQRAEKGRDPSIKRQLLIAQLTGPKPPTFPALSQSEQGGLWVLSSGVVRYFIAKDPKFDPLKFEPQPFATRMREVAELMSPTNPDLSAFNRRGGKLIMRANLADYAVGPFGLFDYYKSVVNLMGNNAVDQFVRLYVSPGSPHPGPAFSSIDGAPVPSQADLLSVLDAWVENGRAPPYRLTQTLHTKEAPFSVLASRPMCAYPGYPHYVGAGNPKNAES